MYFVRSGGLNLRPQPYGGIDCGQREIITTNTGAEACATKNVRGITRGGAFGLGGSNKANHGGQRQNFTRLRWTSCVVFLTLRYNTLFQYGRKQAFVNNRVRLDPDFHLDGIKPGVNAIYESTTLAAITARI
jgi:hypothetical protein